MQTDYRKYFYEDDLLVCSMIPFYKYVQLKTGMDKTDFLTKVKEPDKLKILLKWKHGLEDDGSNKTLEQSDNDVLATRVSNEFIAALPNEKDKKFWTEKIRFAIKCNEYRKEMGLNQTYVLAQVPVDRDIEVMSFEQMEKLI